MDIKVDVNMILVMLTCLIILDIVTGFVKAMYLGSQSDKALESRVMSKGILRKISIYSVIALAYILEHILGKDVPIVVITTIYYVVNESLSILENIGQCIELPRFLKKRIEVLKDHIDDKED